MEGHRLDHVTALKHLCRSILLRCFVGSGHCKSHLSVTLLFCQAKANEVLGKKKTTAAQLAGAAVGDVKTSEEFLSLADWRAGGLVVSTISGDGVSPG